MLGGIEFRTVRRLFDERHIVGDLQRSRTMTGSAVQHHRDVLIRMSLRHLRKEDRQRRRIHVRKDQRIEFSILWTDGGEGVGVLPDDLASGLGTLSRLTPCPSRVGDSAEAALILEHQPEATTMQDRFDFSPGDHSGGKKL